MKISEKVIEKYQEHCPLSAGKCESYHEIEYKIQRAIKLGKVIKLNDDGSVVYGYYHLQFTVKNNKVINIDKNKNCKYVNVKECQKYRYDQIHSKIVV